MILSWPWLPFCRATAAVHTSALAQLRFSDLLLTQEKSFPRVRFLWIFIWRHFLFLELFLCFLLWFSLASESSVHFGYWNWFSFWRLSWLGIWRCKLPRHFRIFRFCRPFDFSLREPAVRCPAARRLRKATACSQEALTCRIFAGANAMTEWSTGQRWTGGLIRL